MIEQLAGLVAEQAKVIVKKHLGENVGNLDQIVSGVVQSLTNVIGGAVSSGNMPEVMGLMAAANGNIKESSLFPKVVESATAILAKFNLESSVIEKLFEELLPTAIKSITAQLMSGDALGGAGLGSLLGGLGATTNGQPADANPLGSLLGQLGGLK